MGLVVLNYRNSNSGGIICNLNGGIDNTAIIPAFFLRTQQVKTICNFIKSLVIHPATTTHSQLTDEELADQGIKPNTIRLSIGTEHIDDIIADLQRGFDAVKEG